jgi:proteasome regulatory subunit
MQTTPGNDENEKLTKDKQSLLDYIKFLEKRIKNVENEKDFLTSERLRLESNLKNLINEIEVLREPPLITGHVIDLLDPDGERVVIHNSSGADYVVKASSKVIKEDLKPGMKIALNQHTFAIMEIIPTSVDPFIKALEIIDSVPMETYGDIGGLDDVIQEVRETVELPLKKPELFKKIGIEPPKGILLYGAPGTGKTLVAKAVAHETQATFIRIVGSELVQKFIGEGARYVREVFEMARKKAPTIIFVDELDAIGAYRMEDATSGDREVHRTLMQLLSELDGFDTRGDVKFIGATNRIDILDPALLRPGRFDRMVEFPMPNEKAREAIFKVHMRPLNVDNSIDWKYLLKATENATGADIKAICLEAGMFSIRRDEPLITNDDFIKAVVKVLKKKEFNLENPNFFA